MKNIISASMCLALFCLVFAPFSAFAQYTGQQAKFIPSPISDSKISFGENGFQRSSVKTNNFDDLLSKARNDRNFSVIAGLNLATMPEGFLGDDQKIEQRKAIKVMQNDLISQLSRFQNRILAKYDYIPFIALTVNEDLLKFLNESPLVSSIEENRQHELTLAQSIPIIGADDVWNLGYTGNGKVIAIIDSGVDKVHPFLANKVVSEACYSQASYDFPEVGGTENLCGGFEERTDPGSGVPCGYGTADGVCSHGTHVAGIAAGNGTNSGVAKGANLISIMVMTRSYQYLPNGHTISGVRAYSSDIIKGLERVLYLKNNTTLDITSVNISIGDGIYTSSCGVGGSYETVITNLKSLSIATVIASGNDNSTTGISSPACVEPAVSVGATGDGSSYQLCNNNGCTTYSTPIDQIWSVPSLNLGTNSANFLDLLAPGAAITSSVPGGAFSTKSGTSMAAPHVAGAWAVLRQRFPNASVDQILNALKVTGTPIIDTRSGANNRVKPRINVDLAFAYLQQQLRKPRFDFNNDGKTDVSLYRPSDNHWYVRNTDGSSNSYFFGLSTDKLVPDDFTGDGRTDIAVWRGSTGDWYVLNIATSTYTSFNFGTSGDIPVTGDFDGDGKADAVAYRPSEGKWYILKSTGGNTTTQFGIAEDKPVVEDYDGDGKADIAIFRPSVSQWWVLRSSDSVTYSVQFGASGDKTVQGDYTGDGKADLAIFRPSTGFWYILRSEDSSFYGFQYGFGTDIVVPGDYDGDGKTDSAVFRPSEGNWYISGSTSGYQTVNFGASTDTPIPNVYSVP